MAEIVFMKYCPLCGAENPRQQAFCTSCLDGDLSTTPVEPRRKQPAAKVAAAVVVPEGIPVMVTPEKPADTRQVGSPQCCILETIDNANLRFTVIDGQTVGRTDAADVALHDVPKLDWISGVHVRLFRRNEQWYAQHMGGTNFIKVDGEMYSGHEEVAIYDGSILVLSLTPFRVVLGSKD
ncbi:MAG: FHA domain-containing protein [bacterium]